MTKRFAWITTRPLALATSAACAFLIAGSSVAQAADGDDDGREDNAGTLMLALDLEYASAVSSDFIDNGGGGALRVGSQLDLLLVTLIPELTVDYHTFAGNVDSDITALTGKVGGRIRFLKILEPGIFSHIGVGHLGGAADHTGLAFDAGVTLDLTILPLIDLGIHAAYNRVFGAGDDGFTYGTAGAHVALVL